MKQQFPELPGWQFDLDEVSASVYEVIGEDRLGHRVSAKGPDPDALLEQCRKDALRMVADGRRT
jgi:hypothetical protein